MMILIRKMVKRLPRIQHHRAIRQQNLPSPLYAPEKLDKRLFLFRLELGPAVFRLVISRRADMDRHRKIRQYPRFGTAYDFAHGIFTFIKITTDSSFLLLLFGNIPLILIKSK